MSRAWATKGHMEDERKGTVHYPEQLLLAMLHVWKQANGMVGILMPSTASLRISRMTKDQL